MFRLARSASKKDVASNASADVTATQEASPRARGASTARGSAATDKLQLQLEHARLTKQVSELQATVTKLQGEASGGSSESQLAEKAATTTIDILKAAEKGDLDAVKSALASKPSNKDAKNRFGRTPLMEAARKGHLHVVEHLLSLGANDLERNKFGQSAADFALEQGHLMV